MRSSLLAAALFTMWAPTLLVAQVSSVPPSDEPTNPRAYLGLLGEDAIVRTGQAGALVREVVVEGPAQRAGIKPGDIIVRVDNASVSTFAGLKQMIGDKKPQATIEIGILDNGVAKVIPVVLASTERTQAPPTGPRSAVEEIRRQYTPGPVGKRPMIGVLTRELDLVARQRLKVGDRRGVLVAEVEGGTPAAKAGLASEDVFLQADHQPLSSPADLTRIISAKKPGDRLSLKVWRDGQEIDKTVVIEDSTIIPPIPTSNFEGPIEMLRGEQVREMQARLRQLEDEVRSLKERLDVINSARPSAPSVPSPPPAPTPRPVLPQPPAAPKGTK